MAFDLNGWSDKAKNTADPIERKKYFQLWRKANENLENEHKQFKNKYQNSNYNCNINKQYLNHILPELLLNGNIFIPPAMRTYLVEEYNEEKDRIFALKKLYLDNGMTRSVGHGLKAIESGYGYPGAFHHDHELLMFEVFEFTLTYPEYGDLFVEEWV